MGWDDANIFNEINCKDSIGIYQNKYIILGTFWQISCNYVMELVLSNYVCVVCIYIWSYNDDIQFDECNKNEPLSYYCFIYCKEIFFENIHQ